jgi:hypothetical protein
MKKLILIAAIAIGFNAKSQEDKMVKLNSCIFI